MIISKTPLRISFCGGGTDIRDYYRIGGGAVVSAAIDKYIYCIVKRRFDNSIRVSYSKTEIVDNINKIEHPLIREGLRMMGIKDRIEATFMADIHSRGTGLGSSSSFTVGLLNAFHTFNGRHKSAETLSNEACKVEIGVLKEPIGKQDQYVAAFGGINLIEFNPDETVFVNPIIFSKNTERELQGNLLLFYTGLVRKSRDILKEQKGNIANKVEILDKMKALAYGTRDCLISNDLNKFGDLLNKNWKLKKQLAGEITNDVIDKLYEKGIRAGATGGKILGAGGGGFLLLYCEEKYKKRVRKALSNLRELSFRFEPQGSRIAFIQE
jgi:D-glycero-alpha-D-manno-heptose-7-phosphate kinase